jgi:hypothetical protein
LSLKEVSQAADCGKKKSADLSLIVTDGRQEHVAFDKVFISTRAGE